MPKCRKKVFYSLAEAQNWQKGMDGYKCRYCPFWHTTSGIRGRIQKAKMQSKALEGWFQRKRRHRRKK